MSLKKQTKAQVKAYVKEHGTWQGLVCAAKMYPTEQTSIPLALTKSEDTIIVNQSVQYAYRTNDIPYTLESWLNNWAFYNTSYEEGYYAAFYMQES